MTKVKISKEKLQNLINKGINSVDDLVCKKSLLAEMFKKYDKNLLLFKG